MDWNWRTAAALAMVVGAVVFVRHIASQTVAGVAAGPEAPLPAPLAAEVPATCAGLAGAYHLVPKFNRWLTIGQEGCAYMSIDNHGRRGRKFPMGVAIHYDDEQWRVTRKFTWEPGGQVLVEQFNNRSNQGFRCYGTTKYWRAGAGVVVEQTATCNPYGRPEKTVERADYVPRYADTGTATPANVPAP